MSFSRINGSGWAVGDSFTSSQANSLDIDHTNAFDVRTGQSNVVLSKSVFSGSGARITLTSATGPDSGSSGSPHLVDVNGGTQIHVQGLTADRVYKMDDSTGTPQFGDVVVFFIGRSETHEVEIRDSSNARIYTLGNLATSDGTWFEVWYDSGSWVAALDGHGSRQWKQVFTASGTFTAPPGVSFVTLEGCGGGGGGGAGYIGNTSANVRSTGGGGGGSAPFGRVTVPVTGTSSYTVTIGDGGPGGGGGGVSGSNGTDTTFGSTLATLPGAMGGVGGTVASASGGSAHVPGGFSVRGPGNLSATFNLINASVDFTNRVVGTFLDSAPGCGGCAIGVSSSGNGSDGGRSAIAVAGTSFAGGSGGSTGAPGTGSYLGGGGGGGGAAGPFGVGGGGAAGGAGGQVAINGVAGNTGGTAAANTGAGGGGGSAGGAGGTGGGAPGLGGAGGKGLLNVYWTK